MGEVSTVKTYDTYGPKPSLLKTPRSSARIRETRPPIRIAEWLAGGRLAAEFLTLNGYRGRAVPRSNRVGVPGPRVVHWFPDCSALSTTIGPGLSRGAIRGSTPFFEMKFVEPFHQEHGAKVVDQPEATDYPDRPPYSTIPSINPGTPSGASMMSVMPVSHPDKVTRRALVSIAPNSSSSHRLPVA